MKKTIQIVLNEEKVIREKKIMPGTILGEINPTKRFCREDIDLAMQLGQVKIIEVEAAGEKNPAK